MKKITLTIAAFVAAFTMNAQTTYFSDDFNDGDISDWSVIDEDGDTFNWSAVQIQDASGNPVGTPVMRSASWNSAVGALTPDNYAFSPVIDLTAEDGSETITLSWVVTAADASFADENYSVYVATNNTVADALAAPISFNEIVTDNGPGGLDNPYTKTLDITSMAGQVVYVAFRHHGTSDQFTIEIDDVMVTAGSMSVENEKFANFTHFVDANHNLNLSAKTPMNQVSVFSITGQQVISKKLSATDVQLNLSSLNAGVYLTQVSIEGETKSFKIIKK